MPSKDPEIQRRAVRRYREKLRGTPEYAAMRRREWEKIKTDPEKIIKRKTKKCERHAERMTSDDSYKKKIAANSMKSNERLRALPQDERIARVHKWRLRSCWGLSVQEYDAMLLAQGGGCAICGTTTPGGRRRFLSVDHDHVTGKIRGLLCAICNLGLGKFQDKPELLRTAAAYLERETSSPKISESG